MAANFHRTEDFKTGPMRGSFLFNLYEPRKNKRDDGTEYEQYGSALIAPKNGFDWAPLTAAIKECVVQTWGEASLERLKKGLIKNPILDGGGPSGLDKTTGEAKPGLGPDVMFIRVATQRKPEVWVVKDGRYTLATKEDTPSGSWGIPGLHAYAWHNSKNGDGVSFGINRFLLTKKAEGDEVLGGGGGAKDPNDFYGAIDTSEAQAETSKPSSAAAMFD